MTFLGSLSDAHSHHASVADRSKKIYEQLVSFFEVEVPQRIYEPTGTGFWRPAMSTMTIRCGTTADGRVAVRWNGEWGWRDWWPQSPGCEKVRQAMGEGSPPPPIPVRAHGIIDEAKMKQMSNEAGYG